MYQSFYKTSRRKRISSNFSSKLSLENIKAFKTPDEGSYQHIYPIDGYNAGTDGYQDSIHLRD